MSKDDERAVIRLVQEWHCLIPRMGAGAALNALVTALAAESASAATIVGLKAQLDLIEEERDHARIDRSP
ncbi:hypothetical protein [Streptomyces sp. RKAG293]|uniref:hypothetical protein n=1 Tax=Streptomyces sp. RKAG293 TaxID=2893403 RepID=UPI002033A2D3|nr:hypothetical protein [Streptomyces sp. RKAG293]MCM2419091.1 hypothetical protein [Streptomyces sp. RKAG293]